MISFFKKSPDCFLKWLYLLTFPPAVYERSFFATFSPAFVVDGVFDYSHWRFLKVKHLAY
jgi:hypothetical protein